MRYRYLNVVCLFFVLNLSFSIQARLNSAPTTQAMTGAVAGVMPGAMPEKNLQARKAAVGMEKNFSYYHV